MVLAEMAHMLFAFKVGRGGLNRLKLCWEWQIVRVVETITPSWDSLQLATAVFNLICAAWRGWGPVRVAFLPLPRAHSQLHTRAVFGRTDLACQG